MNHYEAWPALDYQDFKETGYLIHRAIQMLGKLKLHTPFEPHWGNVALWITGCGVTTGAIPYQSGVFNVDIDFIEHQFIFNTSWGKKSAFDFKSGTTADLYQTFMQNLKKIEVELTINPQPQEIPNAIRFDEDTQSHDYDKTLANAWFRILVSSYRVLEQYHARFSGSTPAVGLMWGTFDLRDARYRNIPVPTDKLHFIERNAMDVQQVEAGWWSGDERYPKPAYFSFTYPEPKGIGDIKNKIKPDTAKWVQDVRLFILDYDDVRKSKQPEKDILDFFESTYAVGAEELSGWDKGLIVEGRPK